MGAYLRLYQRHLTPRIDKEEVEERFKNSRGNTDEALVAMFLTVKNARRGFSCKSRRVFVRPGLGMN